MIELKPLQPSDFDTFKSWITNRDQLFQFAGPILDYPVTDKQLLVYTNDPRRKVFKVNLKESGEMVGNAELNFEQNLPRLSRILIGNPAHRNKGLGKQVINELLSRLFIEEDYEQADLNVFDWNVTAIRCYERAGFIINPHLVYNHLIDGVNWAAVNMIITKKRWLAHQYRKG